MTRIVRFDPAAATGLGPASLRDAYSAKLIRSFVAKLRQLAVQSPDTCEAQLRALDKRLAWMLDATSTEDADLVNSVRLVMKIEALHRPSLTRVLEGIVDQLGGAR